MPRAVLAASIFHFGTFTIAQAKAVSAITGQGLPTLSAAIDTRIAAGMEQVDYAIAHADGARLAWLYQHGEVLDRENADEAVRITVRLLPADRARFERLT
jgi:GTP-binding protein HflX